MAIDAERWQPIESIYHAALGRVSEERRRFLAEACAGDETSAMKLSRYWCKIQTVRDR